MFFRSSTLSGKYHCKPNDRLFRLLSAADNVGVGLNVYLFLLHLHLISEIDSSLFLFVKKPTILGKTTICLYTPFGSTTIDVSVSRFLTHCHTTKF